MPSVGVGEALLYLFNSNLVINFEVRSEVLLSSAVEVFTFENDILILIKDYLGGNINYNKLKNEYSYKSSNFSVARKIIKYFSTYHLLSHKYITYLK